MDHLIKKRAGHSDMVEKEFNQLAPTYEENRLARWYKAQATEVLAALGRPEEGVFLDVGCGTGWLLREALNVYPHLKGLGIDVSGIMISRARTSAAESNCNNLTFMKADWETLDVNTLRQNLPAKKIHTAVCVSTFHYFANPYMAAEKLYQCLDPGGRLLLLDRAKEGSFLTNLWDVLHRAVIRDHVRFYSSVELAQLLENVGFLDIQILSTLRRFLWKGKLYTHLVLISARKATTT